MTYQSHSTMLALLCCVFANQARKPHYEWFLHQFVQDCQPCNSNAAAHCTSADCWHCEKQLILPRLPQEPFNYALLCCAGLGWAGLGCAALRRAVLCCTVLEVTGAPTIGLHIAQEVAGQVRKHHDGPKGVSRRQSFKLSHVIENRLARGGSGQGFGPHATQANTLTPLEALSEEPTPQQVCHDADNKQYLNSGDNLEVMKVEFCGNADTHLLKIQACLSWSVTATQIRLLASASGMPIYILAGVSATIIEAHNMMQVWVCARHKSMTHCSCIAMKAVLAFFSQQVENMVQILSQCVYLPKAALPLGVMLTYISASDHCRLLATCMEMLQRWKQPIPLMTVTQT